MGPIWPVVTAVQGNGDVLKRRLLPPQRALKSSEIHYSIGAYESVPVSASLEKSCKKVLHIEKIRNEFFIQLQELLQKQQGSDGPANRR